MSHGNHLFWGQKVKGQGYEAQDTASFGIFCDCSLLEFNVFWLLMTFEYAHFLLGI